MLPATTKHFLYCFTWSLTHCLLQTQVDIVWRVNSTGIAKAKRDESWISQQCNLTLFCPCRHGVDRGRPLLHTFFSNITNKCCLFIAIIAVQDLSSWVFFQAGLHADKAWTNKNVMLLSSLGNPASSLLVFSVKLRPWFRNNINYNCDISLFLLTELIM